MKKGVGGHKVHAQAFDDEGVVLAMLAALEAVYESFPQITLPQYIIALEVRKAERDGVPHTLASLVKKFNMPFSTVSRVVWSLTGDGGEIGVVRYRAHPIDRRKKLLIIGSDEVLMQMSNAATRVMVEYYGTSIRGLRRLQQ